MLILVISTHLSHQLIILYFLHRQTQPFLEVPHAQQNTLLCAVCSNFSLANSGRDMELPSINCILSNHHTVVNMKTNWIIFSMSCCWTSTKSFSQYPSTCWEELTVGFGVFLRKPFHILLRCKNNFVRKELVASAARTFSFFPGKTQR